MNTEAGQEEVAKNILSAVKLYLNSLDNPKKEGENETTNSVNGVAILVNEDRKKIAKS